MSSAAGLSKRTNNFCYLILAHLSIILGYSFNHGLFYNQAQLWLLLIGWFFLMQMFVKKPIINFRFKIKPLPLLLVANLVSFILFYFLDSGIYFQSQQGYNNVIILKFISLVIFSLYLINLEVRGDNLFSVFLRHLKKRKFIYLIILALAVRLLIIFYSPEPKIDVFWLLQDGANDLFHGTNPYSSEFNNIYSPADCLKLYGQAECRNDNYSYLPATIIATLPFRVMGDIRFMYVAAVFSSAAMIYSLTKKKFRRREIPELLTLLLLYLPLSLFILEQSWVDPICVFLIYLFTFLASLGYKYVPYIALGILLGTKQIMAVLLVFISKVNGVNFKKVLVTMATLILIMAPFVVWNFQDLFYDVVTDQINFQDPSHALSFNTLSKNYFHRDIPLIIYAVVLLSLLVYLVRRAPNNLIGFISASTMFLFTVYLLKRGFLNYYYYISAMIILLITLEVIKIRGRSLKL